MPQFIIPTVFTAVNQISPTIGVINNDLGLFSKKAFSVALASEKAFSRLPKIFGSAAKQLLAYGEAAAVFGGAIFTAKSIADYGTEISNLSAVTGAVGADLDKFRQQIKMVATDTKTSTVDVAKAFTAVDNNLPELHKDAAGLGEVTKQSVILARASREEIGLSAEALTMSMNQFGLGAKDARMAIDALSAGAVAGSSRIAETSEALQKFGAAAKNVVKITYPESVALVELASKFEKGAEAGTRLRNILLDMTNIKFGPAANIVKALGVNEDVVSNTSLPFFERFKELSKIRNNPEAMEKLFDKRNVVVASGLFSRVDDYERILNATNKIGGAEIMAAKNTDNLSAAVIQLRDRWITYVTTSDKVNFGVTLLKDGIQFLTNNLGGLLDITIPIVAAFAAWKTQILITRGIAWGYVAVTKAIAFWEGVATVATGKYATAAFATESGIRGMATASFFLEAGLIASLGVVGLVVAALGLLTIAFADDYKAVYQNSNGLEDFKNGMLQQVEPINKATIALNAYNDQMRDYNDLLQFKAVSDYKHSLGFLPGLKFDVINAFKHPVLSSEATDGVNPEIYKPNNPNVDMSEVQKKYLKGENAGDTIINISQDANGKWNANSSKGSVTLNNGIIPSLKPTGNYSR